MTDLAAPTPTTNPLRVSVGDIFYNSWGYDQTNVDYYQVIRVTKSKAEVLPIGSKVVEARGPGGNRVVPDPFHVREWDVIIGIGRGDVKKTKLCTITTGISDEPSLVLQSGQHWAWKHHGESQHETDSMFGH